ncbi:MAG: ABC transporter permease subunit [Planctomycetes bacterium]|nr:ABC transporter permease subunit [Planctomycetota bacterium]MCG2683918.1 ABC transporter permease subunit [Planctomycetales bacterium]
MKLANVKLILAREVRDQLRDRRTLFVIAVLPILLYPLLGMSLFQMSQFMHVRPARVLVVGGRDLGISPALIEEGRFAASLFSHPKEAERLKPFFPPTDNRLLKKGATAGLPSSAGRNSRKNTAGQASSGTQTPEIRLFQRTDKEESDQWDEARSLVQAGAYEAALYFPADFSVRLEEFRKSLARRSEARAAGEAVDEAFSPDVPQPKISYNGGNEKSLIASVRLTEVLRRWTQRIGDENLKASGLSARTARPFTVDTDDVAGRKSREGVKWSSILPVLLLLWALTGAFYPAVDLCAGEKERGTLETLLSSPAGRGEIVLGKLLTIMLFSIITAVLNLVSVGATGWIVLSRLPGFGLPPPVALVSLAIALLPMAALFSALCLALAALARSTREGQYYLMPLLLLTMPLVVLPMSPGVELNLGNSLIPVTGVALILRSMLAGEYWQALQFAPVVAAVTLVVCLVSIRWAVDQFNRESVLFRESERFDVGLWLRHLLRDRRPTPTVGAAVCCCVLILLIKFYLGSIFDVPKFFGVFARTFIITQIAVFIVPALLLTFLLTSSPRQTLLLKWPSWFAIPAAALLAVTLHPAAKLLQLLVQRLYPISENLRPSLEQIQGLINQSDFWSLVLLIAVVPAVCEELACRGFILSGFRHLGHKWRAIVYSALLFGLAHGILQQSLLASLIGVVIAYLAVQSGSILPGMVFHAVHNTLALANTRVAPEVFVQWPIAKSFATPDDGGGCMFTWPVVVGGTLVGLLLLSLFARIPCPKSPEESLEEAIERGQHADKPLEAEKAACGLAADR